MNCSLKTFQCSKCQDFDKEKRVAASNLNKQNNKFPTSPDKRMIQGTPGVSATLNHALDHVSARRREDAERIKESERLIEQKLENNKRKRNEAKRLKTNQKELGANAKKDDEFNLDSAGARVRTSQQK